METKKQPDENTEIVDIVCPACGGMVVDTPNPQYTRFPNWVSPINLYCGACDIEWRI